LPFSAKYCPLSDHRTFVRYDAQEQQGVADHGALRADPEFLFMDGTSRHLSWFDQLKADDTHADLLGTSRLASLHTVKRFLGAFSFCTWDVGY